MSTEQKKNEERKLGFAEIARRTALTGLLLFVAMAVGGCGQQKEEAEPTPTVTAAPTATAEITTAPSATPTIRPTSNIVVLPMNEEAGADLDQNGTTERIIVRPDGQSEWFEGRAEGVSIQINDTVFDRKYIEETLGVYSVYIDTEQFYLFDIDAADPYLEIALYDDGPSNDPITRVFRYVDESLVYIGYFTDKPGDARTGSVIIPGDGTVVATTRLGVLQTWWAEGLWQIEDGELVEIQKETYLPYAFEEAPDILLKQDVNAWKEPDWLAETISFTQGEAVTFLRVYQMSWSDLGYDCSAWVEMQNAEGVTGWFFCNEEYKLDFADGTLGYGTDVFENLNMVD